MGERDKRWEGQEERREGKYKWYVKQYKEQEKQIHGGVFREGPRCLSCRVRMMGG